MIVSPSEFDMDMIAKCDIIKRARGRQKKGRRYLNLVTAFDIETTRIKSIEQSVMYVWQWQMGNNITVVGRTWPEFIAFAGWVSSSIPEDAKLIVLVHNLSYEFQFLSGVYHFAPEDVFAVQPRKVLRADMMGNIEFRCTLIQTNMSLRAFLKEMRVPTQKLTMDYDQVRYPWTELTPEELAYCVADVEGLVQAFQVRMAQGGDTLQTVPLTSTGYVRRSIKQAMREWPRAAILDQKPCMELFDLLRDAYRGGNTHSNRFYTARVINGPIYSADRASSYPDVICNCKFPASMWSRYKGATIREVENLIFEKKKCVVFRIGFYNLRLKPEREFYGFPYLSIDKAHKSSLKWNSVDYEHRNEQQPESDNGRIISCAYARFSLTDLDYRIVRSQYDCDQVEIFDCWACRYGSLPQPIIEETKKFFRAKTELKGVAGEELNYNLAKALLNAIYGMMVQNPVKMSDLFTDIDGIEELWSAEKPNEGETMEQCRQRKLDSFCAKNPIVYSWGVYVCAWARVRLEEALLTVENTAGAVPLYCDTDSVKYIGDVDWTDYNNKRIAASTQSGAWADNRAGKRYYMGIMDQEDEMTEAAFLGAKKYAYRLKKEPCHRIHITIAGVNKHFGGIEMEQLGGLQAFCESARIDRPGMRFILSGGNEIIYNDHPPKTVFNVDGHELQITRNAVIRPSTYELGIAGDYYRLITINDELFTEG